jgi:hypothetical protein
MVQSLTSHQNSDREEEKQCAFKRNNEKQGKDAKQEES